MLCKVISSLLSSISLYVNSKPTPSNFQCAIKLKRNFFGASENRRHQHYSSISSSEGKDFARLNQLNFKMTKLVDGEACRHRCLVAHHVNTQIS